MQYGEWTWDMLIQTLLFSPQRVCYFCRFTFPFLFYFFVCVLKTVRWAWMGVSVPTTHKRSSGCCQHLDWKYLFNVEGFWWWSVVCQKEKFKYMHIILCHRNLYYDWFLLRQYTVQMFYSWIVIFAETLWVSISFSSAECAMNIFFVKFILI